MCPPTPRAYSLRALLTQKDETSLLCGEPEAEQHDGSASNEAVMGSSGARAGGRGALCLLQEDGLSLGQLSPVSAALPQTSPSQAVRILSLQAPACCNFPRCKVMLVGGGVKH